MMRECGDPVEESVQMIGCVGQVMEQNDRFIM
jgi:hypothetical protein